jgi:histidinol-phosphatase (PHP family)
MGFDFEEYFTEIERLQNQYWPLGLKILSGVEIGNPQDFPIEVDSLLSQYNFDIVIASQHWLDGRSIHRSSCFDQQYPQQIYFEYFSKLGELVKFAEFDILGHFDRIFWQGMLLYKPPILEELEGEIRAFLNNLAKREKILELNTTYLKHVPNWNNFLSTMISWYVEEGGVLVAVNSDAHRKEEIGRYFDIGQNLLFDFSHLQLQPLKYSSLV